MRALKCWHVWTFNGEAWTRHTDEPMTSTQAGRIAADLRKTNPRAVETRLELESFRPLAVGDTVKHSEHVIRRARDYFLSCGRQPMKEGARVDLEKKTAARGIVEAVRANPDAVRVKWTNGTVSDCLAYMVERTEAGK